MKRICKTPVTGVQFTQAMADGDEPLPGEFARLGDSITVWYCGEWVKVNVGDWVIRNEWHCKMLVSQADFDKSYEQVPEQLVCELGEVKDGLVEFKDEAVRDLWLAHNHRDEFLRMGGSGYQTDPQITLSRKLALKLATVLRRWAATGSLVREG